MRSLEIQRLDLLPGLALGLAFF